MNHSEKYGLCVIKNSVKVGSLIAANVPLWCGMLIVGELCSSGDKGYMGKSWYLPSILL